MAGIEEGEEEGGTEVEEGGVEFELKLGVGVVVEDEVGRCDDVEVEVTREEGLEEEEEGLRGEDLKEGMLRVLGVRGDSATNFTKFLAHSASYNFEF